MKLNCPVTGKLMIFALFGASAPAVAGFALTTNAPGDYYQVDTGADYRFESPAGERTPLPKQ